MAKKQTSTDLLREIKSMVTDMNARLHSLENWRVSTNAARIAVEEYKREEREESKDESITEILKQLAPFLVAGTVLLYALAQGLTR